MKKRARHAVPAPRRVPRLPLAALAAVVAVLVVVGLRSRTPAPSVPSPPAPSATTTTTAARAEGRRLGLAKDTTYTYALEYASDNTTSSLPGIGATESGAEALLLLDGTLALHAFPSEEDLLVGWSVTDVSAATLRVLGEELWKGKTDAQATFADAEMYVNADANGRPRLLRSQTRDSGLFDHVMQLLVQDLSVELGAGEKWTASETSPHGVARSTYSASQLDGNLTSLRRERDQYTLLRAAAGLQEEPNVVVDSLHEGVLTPEGYVETWSGRESVIVRTRATKPLVRASTKLSLRLLSVAREARPLPSLEGVEARVVSEPAEAKTSRARMLEARIAGLTEEEALASIAAMAVVETLPDHEKFLRRVVALTELRPAFCDRLAELFERSPRGERTQASVLDILANAGTEKAQATMRRLLERREALDHESFAALVQRFSLVDRPTPETGRWVSARMKEATRDKNDNRKIASAYALGSVADKLRETGDESGARAHEEELRAMLRVAETDTMVAYFVTALANTDSMNLAGWVGGHASHSSPDVRAAVAAALDEPPTPEGTRILLELAGDPDHTAQNYAIRSLRRHELSDANLQLLAGFARQGRFHSTNLRALLDMTKVYRGVHPVGLRDLYASLLAHGVDDPEVRAAIALLMG